MNIYEMTGYALELMELLDAEEIDEQTVANTLEGIGADEKIDSYCKIIENYKSDISGIDEAIARLKARKERAEKNIDRMKQALDGFMQATRQDKAKTKLFTVSYRKSTSVEIIDEDLIPHDLIKVKTTTAPDKALIKKILDNGGTVDGCILKKSKNIQIK